MILFSFQRYTNTVKTKMKRINHSTALGATVIHFYEKVYDRNTFNVHRLDGPAQICFSPKRGTHIVENYYIEGKYIDPKKYKLMEIKKGNKK